MDNFNKVFLVIKKYCGQQKRLVEISCFDAIAREANTPIGRLPIYLDYLQDVGLIKYSLEKKYIYLTFLGIKQDSAAVAKAVC